MTRPNGLPAGQVLRTSRIRSPCRFALSDGAQAFPVRWRCHPVETNHAQPPVDASSLPGNTPGEPVRRRLYEGRPTAGLQARHPCMNRQLKPISLLAAQRCFQNLLRLSPSTILDIGLVRRPCSPKATSALGQYRHADDGAERRSRRSVPGHP